MVFHWSLSVSKSWQVSRTLLRILTDLNSAVVWMVSTHPLISKSSTPIILIIITLWEFFKSTLADARSLEFEMQQVSSCLYWTLLGILADLNKAVVWMVSNLPLISKLSSLCISHLVTAPVAPITIVITVIFMSEVSLIPKPGHGTYSFFAFFQFYSIVSRYSTVHISASSLFCWLLLRLVVWPRLGDP